MIKLSFVIGGSLRKVYIKDRNISLLSQETGYTPISIDLDKLESKKKSFIKKLGKEGMKLMKEVAELKTEEEMARDIIKDFQNEGWRLIKREDGS